MSVDKTCMKSGMLTYARYPFIVDAKKYLSQAYGYQVTLRDLADDKRVSDIAKQRLYDAIEKGEVRAFDGITAEESVASFYLAAAAVASADSRRLEEIFSRAEAKRAGEFLKSEDVETLLALAKNMGIKVVRSQVKIPWIQLRDGRVSYKALDFAVPVTDYLKVVAPAPEARWSLVNSMVKAGLVYMDRDTLRDFLVLTAEKAVLKVVGAAKAEDYKPRLLAQEALRALSAKDAKISVAGGSLNFEAFPPCMARLRSSAKTDEELYAYISFLAAIGAEEGIIAQEMARLLGVSQEVARKLTSGLLEAGLGSVYKPYNCKFMKDRGLCPVDCGASHPLLAYRRNLGRAEYSQLARRA
jgi:DNA primase large subunit